jgi:antitoxin CptB
MTSKDSKLLWRCRRGARELDAILVPYGLNQIQDMSAVEKSNLEQLLQQQDPDLLDWFLGKSVPADPSIADAVGRVLTFNHQRESVKRA